MITEAQYVEECLRQGVRGHCHDGVWWREPFPFYAKPMFEFRELAPGSARPSFRKAPLGYSHHVPDPALGNRSLPYMILHEAELRGFGLESLSSKKRNQVRKGLKHCEVALIQDIERHLEAIRGIYISQSMRHTEQHEIPKTPPSFYVDHASQWRERELRYLTTCGRETWGAFIDGRLAGFIVSPQIEGVRIIEKAKCHTDFLSFNVNDALYFTVLEAAGKDALCRKIVNPGLRGGRLARYKEQFLFKQEAIPVYVSHPMIFNACQRLRALAGRRHAGSTAAPREAD